jgi:exodeoxyribonuclease VII large subunit
MPEQELLFEAEEKAQQPLSVLDFIGVLNGAIHGIEASVVGEVSKASFPPSGHVYFDLKDESGDGVLHCVAWKSIYENLGIALEAGMRIVVLGSPDIYAPRGDLSFRARAIELTGEGVLKKRYEELKKKLAAEGMFTEERKRPLPAYPERIGIVTSKNGAVIHDILNNLGRFGFKVFLVDARVEGPGAAQSLMDAIKRCEKMPLDVLIIARGGGSMEALQAFDNEKLVRALVDFPVSVIAAIGHHQDVPLTALAADIHVSTPTAAANLLNQSWQEASFRLAHDTENIFTAYGNIMGRAKQSLDFSYYMECVRTMRRTVLERLAHAAWQTTSSFDNLIRFARMRLETAGRVIAANDPMRNLRIGYAMVRQHGKIVKHASDMPPDSEFEVQFSDGIVEAKVMGAEEQEREKKE